LNDTTIYEFKMTPTVELYYNEDSLYGVYKFWSDNVDIPYLKKMESYNFISDRNEIKFEGMLAGRTQKLTAGTEYTIKAKLEFSKKYKNYNYVPISVGQDLPKSLDDQKKFLQSVCTPLQAETLLDQYPDIVQMIVDGREDEIDLSKTKGIKEITFENVKNKVLDNYAISDVLSLLIPLGISFSKIGKLLGGEPNPIILKEKILDDPYILSDIDGVTWKTIDRIAVGLNPEFKESKKRIISFIKNYLRDIGESIGNTWVHYEELSTAVSDNLQECLIYFDNILDEQKEFPTFLHIDDQDSEDKNNWLICSKYYYDTELKIWNLINQFNNKTPLEITDEEIKSGIKLSEKEQGFEFLPQQKELLYNMTKNNFNIITGKSGCGKTTLTRGLISIYKEKYIIGACALSAKAAVRLQEVTGQPAMTIHRLLAAKGLNTFEYNEYNRLPYDIIICDEISMVYSGLFYHLISAVKNGAKIILVGDSAQLSPLSWGNLLVDLLDKKNLQINYLTKIMRQALDSAIVTDANLLRDGVDPLDGLKTFKEVRGAKKDLVYMFRSDKNDIFDIAIKTYLKSIEDVGLDNVYLITPRKDNADVSTKTFNKKIQDLLLDNTLPYVLYGKDMKYKLGAKVIHRKNNYNLGVTNGEQGYIVEVLNLDNNEGDGIIVKYGDKTIEYTKRDLGELNLAYSITVHLAQGSESDTVIVALDSSSYTLLNNCLLYTAITRAKSKCLLLSQPYSYDKCVKTNVGNHRDTWMQFFN
jgi:exodeoxyribonuclease V alpha subunit